MDELISVTRSAPAKNTIMVTKILDAYAQVEITNKKVASGNSEEKFLEDLAQHLGESVTGFTAFKFIVLKSILHFATARYSKQNIQGVLSINVCGTRIVSRAPFLRAICQYIRTTGLGFEKDGRRVKKLTVAVD